MAEDKFDTLGPMLSDIGAEIAAIVGGNPDGAYLYAEAGERWVGAGVFKQDGAVIRYFDPSDELSDLLLDIWDIEDPDKRWAVLEYEITGTTFNAKMKYPEEIDPKENEVERRPRALQARFGDREVVYPPMPTMDD